MKKTGIIGAMETEVCRLKELLTDITISNIAGMEFYEGILVGRPVVVVRSGVGKVNAAVCTQILIDRFEVNRILNTGAAGSLDNRIDIGDIVLSTEVIHHDVDATMFGYPYGQLPQMQEFAFPADDHLRALASEACGRVNMDLHIYNGKVLSGDQFIHTDEKKFWLVDHFNGLCCEMEGAAIGHTAYINHIPFLVIRVISDKADHSISVDYQEFEDRAAASCVRFILAILEIL